MRLLANENFPRAAVEALRADGHDVAWIRTDAPGISDDAVLDLARGEGRVLLTFDKDFGELVLKRGARASHGIILFRFPLSAAPRDRPNRGGADRVTWRLARGTSASSRSGVFGCGHSFPDSTR